MPTTPGALPTALDRLWDALRELHPELPPARVAISTTPVPSSHASSRWGLDDEGWLTGLSVGADVLRAGAEVTLTYILHEAAHVLNWRRGVKDTTSGGWYHNGRFMAAAEEVGLTWPEGEETSAGRGVPTPVLSDETRRRWAGALADVAPAIDEIIPVLAPPSSRPTRQDRITAACECTPPRRFRITKKAFDPGPIVCGVCGKLFAAQP